jgi:mono/diheme cytochrome c family protein
MRRYHLVRRALVPAGGCLLLIIQGCLPGPAWLGGKVLPWVTVLASATPAPLPQNMQGASGHYRRFCARCHDQDFTGSGYRPTNRRIPDFTDQAWQAERSNAQLFVSILDGKGTGMPSFRGRLSEEEARALVAYLRKAAPPVEEVIVPAAAPDEFARRYRDLLKQLEDLKEHYRRLNPTARVP